MDPTNALKVEAIPPEPPEPHAASVSTVAHPLVAAGGEQCPSCGHAVASDQRYCLDCGQRCGEPRLPFMNAVTFMDAMKKPSAAAAAPPSKPKQRRMSPNAALIAGVGTLLLAMGVGVLIGHSGSHSAASSTPAAPQIIKVPAAGGAETATATGGDKAAGGGGGGKTKGKKQNTASLKKEAETQAGAEEVLKPSGNVKLPPATVKPGSSCPSGTTGCKHGEFTGEFFGE
jgi:hypothetical protein